MLNIRRAKEEDIPRFIDLLYQVNLVHHNGRPDIFNIGTKYTKDELKEMIKDDTKPIFVAADENNYVLGYSFTIFKITKDDNILTDQKSLYIDDLCVDEKQRGKHIGSALYHAVCDFAKENHCDSVTLNVWELNGPAKKFYEKMGLKPLKTVMENKL